MLFNVSLVEFIFILLIMFIFLGTDDMVKIARKVGVWISKFLRSETYQAIQKTASELRSLPQKIIQEAELDKSAKEIKNELDTITGQVNREVADQTKTIEGELEKKIDIQTDQKN